METSGQKTWAKNLGKMKYFPKLANVHRNRKRFLLSQSKLREEFVEKKHQVFDIIGLLIILVQVNLSSPVERVKRRGILESVNHNNRRYFQYAHFIPIVGV